MPWTTSKDGLKTRFRLSGGWSLGSVFAVPFSLLLFSVFGPGFLGAGSMNLDVRCERGAEAGAGADCRVTQGFLFGLVPFRHSVSGATGVGHATSRGSKGGLVSRLVFQTPAGELPLLTLASNVNEDEKQEVQEALAAYFAGTEATLSLRVGFYNVFALFGAPCTLLWLFIVWSLVTAPLGLFFRAGVEVDPMARTLRVRARPGPHPMRELALADLVAVEVSHNPGGWLGSLVARSGQLPARGGRSPEPQLHLHLVLRGGERVVVRNFFKIPDESMHALRQALAEATGAPTSGSPAPVPGQRLAR